MIRVEWILLAIVVWIIAFLFFVVVGSHALANFQLRRRQKLVENICETPSDDLYEHDDFEDCTEQQGENNYSATSSK
jgi:hypothetical protein